MEENVLPNVCRACMTEDGVFQSMFLPADSTGLKIHLAEMVMAYASVQISSGDGLPELICTNCVKKVSEFYLFKLKCEETDRNLRLKLEKSPKIETKTNEFNSLASNSFDVVIKQESAVDFEDTPNLISIEKLDVEKLEIDNYIEIEDSKVEIPTEEQVVEIEKKIFFECDICYKCFPRNGLLVKHKQIHEYKVNQSDGQFQNNLDIDLKTHFDQKCPLCGFLCESEESYTEHLSVHQKSDDLTCEACNKTFSKKSHLRRHMVVHATVKPHNCNICSKGFNRISNLKDHMRIHNGKMPFLCATCGKGFNHLGNLRQHTIRHSGIKAHLCNTCGSGFATKAELAAHLRKHTGSRPYVCSVCNKGFSTSSYLSKHKRIHSGEKPHECEICKMKFSRSGILARHKRTHTGEKPYVCNYCSKAFSQSNDLNSHLRIHTGEKPYICDACGQAFRQSSTLKTHKKIHVDKKTLLS